MTRADEIIMQYVLKFYLFLKVDDQELVNESDIVSGVVPMPHSQEDEGS